MDKKNTILLMAIAVATLLVAVVGASYAYFMEETVLDDQLTIVTTNGQMGHVNLSNPNNSFKLNFNDSKFAPIYYATNLLNSSDYDEEKTFRKIAVLTVKDDNPNNKYKCSFNLSITLYGDMCDVLDEKDGFIELSGGNISGVTDLSEIKKENDYTKTYSVELNEISSISEGYIEAAIGINKTSKNQKYLEGKSLEVMVNNTDFNCELIK